MMERGARCALALAGLAALTSCVAPSQPVQQAQRLPVRPPVAPPPRPLPPPVAGPPLALKASITALGSNFPGKVGIAVRDVRSGWTVSYNGLVPRPQQSVSKLWVAITVLDAVDRGMLALDDTVVVGRDDLTVFHQPISAEIGKDGLNTTIAGLLARAMTTSDNTANDVLLRRAGGPQAVRGMVARKGLGTINFGEGERLLQSEIAGLKWRPEYAFGQGFRRAREAIPLEERQAALDRYVSQPMDGAAPDAVVAALARLQRGELLSARSTALLLDMMRNSRTGPQRLRSGLPPGWTLAHKTGTGQQLSSVSTGYNDVGIVVSPEGRAYAIAVMIASTQRSIPERQKLMGDVVRAVTAYR